ncbi:MAG: protein-L-isoaspartate O-methyltransferase [Proteobacteria bacterium]|nr:protein-L-isoaspartate O-methyltransferase [Pseudomonadota bacterium]
MERSISGTRLCQQLQGQIRNKHVLTAVRAVAREQFVDASLLPFAGDDSALPIGHEQTTSAPLVIARMLEMMLGQEKPPLHVLEIGSGCGYQTALLAEMGCQVVSIERIAALASAAHRRLEKIGYNTVEIIHGDGFLGNPEQAPFDGILVCAECTAVPPLLLAQLTQQARLVLPLRTGNNVHLTAVNASGRIVAVREQVRFVNMLKGTI